MAECARMTVIAAPLSRGRMSLVVDRVLCKSTPGSSVDLLVTQYGIAVNPTRPKLREALGEAGLPLKEIGELKALAEGLNGIPMAVERRRDRVAAKVLNRDGSLLDVIYGV